MNSKKAFNAPGRAEAYRLLVAPFAFPNRESAEELQQGRWGERLQHTLSGLDPGNPLEKPLRLDADFDPYESEFIGLHEVGLGGAPCPLHSGHYGRDRMKTLEEVVRFYHFFDYEPERTVDRFQDHLVFELGFMTHLIGIEMAGSEAEAGSSRRAQKDFVDRHLASWLPALHQSVGRRAGLSFVRDAVCITAWFVSQDQNYLCGT